MLIRVLLVTLLAIAPSATAAAQERPPDECADWQACRERTTEALARGEYEAAHDLAWRAVQKGPKRNNELLYLLARAQCLSGRPHDALVMLGRLADTGVAAGAATDADFRRARELAGWPAVAERLVATAASA